MKPAAQIPFAAKAIPVVLIILCLTILFWASQRATAAWQFFAAETITQNMHAKAFTAVGLEQATARVNKALERFPNNPDYLGLAGHLKELGANLPGVLG